MEKSWPGKESESTITKGLPGQTAHLSSRVNPFCFSCNHFARFCTEMQETLECQAQLGQASENSSRDKFSPHTQSNYDRFSMKNPSLKKPIRFSIKQSSEIAYLVNRFCCYFKFFSLLLQEFYLFLIFPERNVLEAYPHILEHSYIAQIDANLSVSMFECFI